MDFRLYWIALWVVFLILEMFVMSFDFLALGIAAFVAALLSYMLGIDVSNRYLSGAIFLVAAIMSILLTRLLVLPKIRGTDEPSPMSGDSIIGKKFVVQHVNKRDVIKYEGMFRNIHSDADYAVWDTVTVISMDDNVVKVKR